MKSEGFWLLSVSGSWFLLQKIAGFFQVLRNRLRVITAGGSIFYKQGFDSMMPLFEELFFILFLDPEPGFFEE